MSNKKDKAIRVTERTRDTLRAIRMVNETYDDTIKRVIYELNELENERKAWREAVAKEREGQKP